MDGRVMEKASRRPLIYKMLASISFCVES